MFGTVLIELKVSAGNLHHADCGDEDTLNRILWLAARGDAPYPMSHAVAGDDDDD